jgi:hypothetical protein
MSSVNEHIIVDHRRERTRQLLKFTMAHCTDKLIREEVRTKFSDIASEMHSDESTNVPHVTLQVGTLLLHQEEQIMGDKIETGDLYGSVVGSHVHDVNLTQTWNQLRATVDLVQLAEQLSSLRTEMLKQAKGPEQYAAVGAVSSAELEAKNGNGPKTLEYLSKAGKWALDVATKVGETVAAAALKEAMGIK